VNPIGIPIILWYKNLRTPFHCVPSGVQVPTSSGFLTKAMVERGRYRNFLLQKLSWLLKRISVPYVHLAVICIGVIMGTVSHVASISNKSKRIIINQKEAREKFKTLYNEEHHFHSGNLVSSILNSMRSRWAKHVARIAAVIKLYRILV
jgi:hypothetical protein